LNFLAIYYLSKVIRTFQFPCKTPFEIFGEGIFPVKKVFIDETPKRHFLGSIGIVGGIARVYWFSGLVSRTSNEKQMVSGKVG
jgi:hypothetical protein